jgi:hypothetical protein
MPRPGRDRSQPPAVPPRRGGRAALTAILAILVVLAAGCVRGGGALPGEPGASGDASVLYHRLGDLAIGDCVDLVLEADDQELLAVVRQPCRIPHDAEVIGLAIHPTSPLARYPGERELLAWAEHECLAAVETYVGVPYKDADLMATYYIPTLSSWTDGDRASQCLATAQGGERLEGSVRAGGG